MLQLLQFIKGARGLPINQQKLPLASSPANVLARPWRSAVRFDRTPLQIRAPLTTSMSFSDFSLPMFNLNWDETVEQAVKDYTTHQLEDSASSSRIAGTQTMKESQQSTIWSTSSLHQLLDYNQQRLKLAYPVIWKSQTDGIFFLPLRYSEGLSKISTYCKTISTNQGLILVSNDNLQTLFSKIMPIFSDVAPTRILPSMASRTRESTSKPSSRRNSKTMFPAARLFFKNKLLTPGIYEQGV